MPPKKETRRFHLRAVERVIGSMRLRFGFDYPVADMADVACMSPFHFIRVFRSLTGVPPSRYLSAIRLQEAKRLLLETDLSVTDVCFEVGYSSLGTFTRRFSEVCGIPPRQFRTEACDEGAPSVGALAGAATVSAGRVVGGRVLAPADFEGLIFVGAFESSIPQGRPAACAILDESGSFRLHGLNDGSYFIMAAGLRTGDRSDTWFLYDNALRATAGKVTVRGGRVADSLTLTLREALPTDPPILLSFPSLLAGRWSGGRRFPSVWKRRSG